MRHLYTHVPFCTRRCVYCDFSIAVRKEVPAKAYVEAVLAEKAARQTMGEWDEEELETLYLGGGTPSLLPHSALAELVEGLLAGEPRAEPVRELTIEVNPDDVTVENAREWVRAGVNRVSVGIQSFSPTVLEWMHRTHGAEQGADAVRILRNAGIQNISLDLIFGLPPFLEHDFGADLARAMTLEPEHLSIYGLTAEPRTALGRRVSRGALQPASDAAYADEFLLAHDVLNAAGYEHYEISNFAKPGYKSIHNAAYWNGSQYGGLGPSAHAFNGRERRWNVSPWAEYARTIAEKGDPTGGREELSDSQIRLERVFLGLRTSLGLRTDEMAGLDGAVIAKAEAEGWAQRKESRWFLSPSGWIRMDELVAALTTSAEGG